MCDWEATAKKHINLCFGKNAHEDRQEYMKEYRKKYREKRSGIVVCECGAKFQELCKYSHRFSRRHEEWVKDKEYS